MISKKNKVNKKKIESNTTSAMNSLEKISILTAVD